MECPYCGTELIWHDYYGKRQYAEHYYIYPQSWIEKQGDIYKCPNSDYFEDIDEAQEYKNNHPELGDINLEEVQCDSVIHNGYFYTDKHDNLHEGYPC